MKTENYKETKLGLIPNDWKIVKIKDFGKVLTGSTPPTSEKENYGNTYLFVSPADLGSEKYIVCTQKRLSNEGFNKSRKFPKGSILFTCIGSSIGKVGIASRELTSNQQINAIIVNNDNYNEFLFYQLENELNRIRLLAGEQAVPIINKSQFESIKVRSTSLPEQKAIAQLLSTWDKAIQSTEKLITQKELRKKWLMQQLLTGKKRLKGFSGEWKEINFRDIANRITRRNTDLCNNVVTISAQRGFVRQEDFFNKRVASETLTNYFLVNRGEFCYNKSYSNGYPMGAFKRLDNLEKAVVTTLYICFGLKENCSSDFMVNFFESGAMNRGLMKIAQEGGRAHGLLNIGIEDFFALKLTIPPKEEQTAIAQVLQAADKEITLLKAKSEKLREQKKGLMQVLLTGKKRLKMY